MKNTIDLNYFQKYVKQKKVEEPRSKEVIGYTRVSSKNQSDTNGSLETQKKSIQDFSTNNRYILKEFFGGTYESAQGDFTRKEFTKLIDYVKNQKVKPFGIVVNTLSRFSRSGGGSIGILNELVGTHKVHLIEVKSGLDTTTEDGLNTINQKLLDSNRENILRKQIIIPGMSNFLSKGNRYGKPPLGYTHYGPRVVDGNRLQQKQELKINEQGELLKEGFRMKLSGNYSDSQILQELKPRGFKGTPQRLSIIWRSPFYCGISTNSLLPDGKPVRGNWEPLINVREFEKLQLILSNKRGGHIHKKKEEYKPLSNFLKCGSCIKHMVGYEVKKKKLTYYKCQSCKGYSLNTETRPKSLRVGGHDLFKSLLEKYEINPKIQGLVIKQLKKVYFEFLSNDIQRKKVLETELKLWKGKLHSLMIKFGLSEIETDVYDLTKEKIEERLSLIESEINKLNPELSNHEKTIEKSIEYLGNISKMWGFVGYEEKQILQKTFFPQGILYDKEKHDYLTPKINSFVLISKCISTNYNKNKKEESSLKNEFSSLVPGTGIEPVRAIRLTGF